MKIKNFSLIFFSFFFLGLIDAKGQTRVDAASIAVMKYNDHSQGLLIGDSISKAITVFGNPTSITTKFNEIDEKQMTLYSYGTNTTLYFMDEVLFLFMLDVGTPFTVGKINGAALTTNSSSISAIGWNLSTTKKETVNITAPQPGGGKQFSTQYYKSGDVFLNDVHTDCYFQVVFVQNGTVKNVALLSY